MLKRIECGISSTEIDIDALDDIKESATSLQIQGMVFLKDDGSIKVVAEGEEDNLLVLIEKIKEVAPFAHNENFYVIWEEPKKEFKDFTVME